MLELEWCDNGINLGKSIDKLLFHVYHGFITKIIDVFRKQNNRVTDLCCILQCLCIGPICITELVCFLFDV